MLRTPCTEQVRKEIILRKMTKKGHLDLKSERYSYNLCEERGCGKFNTHNI